MEDTMKKKTTIKIPFEITKVMDAFIKKSKGKFRSRPEVTVAALKRLLKIKK